MDPFLSMLMQPLAVSPPSSPREELTTPGPVLPTEPPPVPLQRSCVPSLVAALMGLVPLPPAPRPGSGRERHVRRINARRIAKDIRLDVEQVYKALGRGETEAEIRAKVELARGVLGKMVSTQDRARWTEVDERGQRRIV